MLNSESTIQNPTFKIQNFSAFLLQINAPRSPRNGLTKASPNVTKSPCFTPPVATHQLGSEKSTASPSWTPQAGPRNRRESRLESRAPQRRSRLLRFATVGSQPTHSTFPQPMRYRAGVHPSYFTLFPDSPLLQSLRQPPVQDSLK